MQLLILGIVFFGIVLLVVSVYGVINRRALEAADAAREQLRSGAIGVVGPVSILRDDRSSEIPFLDRLLTGRAITTWIAIQLERAGSEQKIGQVLLSSIAGAILGLLLGQRLGMLAALGLALVGAGMPFFLLRRQQAKRTAAFESQLADGLDTLVNALKAGYSLQAAMDYVGRDMQPPLGPEFVRFYDEQRLGMEVRVALLRLQERIGTVDAKMFVTSLLIQRETGGNLGEVLTNLANLMRERLAFRGQLATLTAEPNGSKEAAAATAVS